MLKTSRFLYILNHNVKQTSLPFELTDGDFPTACRFEVKTRQRLPYIELRVSFQNAYTLLLCVRIKLYATIYDVWADVGLSRAWQPVQGHLRLAPEPKEIH